MFKKLIKKIKDLMTFKNVFYDSLDFCYFHKSRSILSGGKWYNLIYWYEELYNDKTNEETVVKMLKIEEDDKIILEGTIKNRKIRKIISNVTFWAY